MDTNKYENKNIILTGGQKGQPLPRFQFEEDAVTIELEVDVVDVASFINAYTTTTTTRTINNRNISNVSVNNNNDNNNDNLETEVEVESDVDVDVDADAKIDADGEAGRSREGIIQANLMNHTTNHNNSTTNQNSNTTNISSSSSTTSTNSITELKKEKHYSLYHYPTKTASCSGNDTNHINNTNNTIPITLNTNGNEIGILSTKDRSYFRHHQEQIDALGHNERCHRYGFGAVGSTTKDTNRKPGKFNLLNGNKSKRKRRRIFLGVLIASEPWELFEIVTTETYGLYDGIVLVESNRTINFSPRQVTLVDNTVESSAGGMGSTTTPNSSITTTTTHIIQHLFQTQNVQLRFYVNEDATINDLDRESAQREDVVLGWKELGMKGEDIGIISDMDVVLTCDF